MGYQNAKLFKVDATCPLRKQQHEPDKQYERFMRWWKAGCPSDAEFAKSEGISEVSIGRHRRGWQWDKRRDLVHARKQESITERMYLLPERRPAQIKRNSTPVSAKRSHKKKLFQAGGDVLPPPPQPIEQGLHAFALRYARLICPGFEIDDVVDLLLTHLEQWVEGPVGGRLLINPPPRHSKTVCSILALCYSLLRYPCRGHILISANGRLSTLSSHMFKTLFENAVEEGYGISQESSSKIAWKPHWEGAYTQLAASRGGALLGYTGHMILADDIIGQVSDLDSPEVQSAAMRTMGVDVMTRLTKDKYNKGAGLCVVAQRLGPNDPTAEWIARDKQAEKDGLPTTSWKVVACPAITPTPQRAAEILAEYPNSWQVFQPQYKEPGTPVSSRFSSEFLESLRIQMPPREYSAMFLLDVHVEDGYCSWKRAYLQEIADDDIHISMTFMAVDMNLVGGKGNDNSAAVIGGVQDGRVVILGLHFLQGVVEHQLAQIVELARIYNVHTIGVEKAAAGDWVMRSMNNSLGDKSFNVVPLSHQGKNKGARLADILGPAANKKFYIRKGLELTETLHQQLRTIATTSGRSHALVDLGDACCYCLSFLWNRWIKSGFGQSQVSWQGGSGNSGVTTCTWGYGAPENRGNLPQLGDPQHLQLW